MPSGEEVGEAFENFLSTIDDRDYDSFGERALPFGEDVDSRLADHYTTDLSEPDSAERDDDDDTGAQGALDDDQ